MYPETQERNRLGRWIDTQDTLFWVRYTLWPGRTPEVICISAEQVDPLRPPKHKGPRVPYEDRDEALFTVESGYPISTSFIDHVKLNEHQGALLRGITFLFDGSSLAEDREAFKG